MYDLNDISVITGLSMRTLRNYINLGVLEGEKCEGKWLFSDEEMGEFLQNPYVKSALNSKRNAIVLDFLKDDKKPQSEICLVFDIKCEDENFEKISRFFCDEVNKRENINFSFQNENGNIRIILKGREKDVGEIMQKYYNK